MIGAMGWRGVGRPPLVLRLGSARAAPHRGGVVYATRCGGEGLDGGFNMLDYRVTSLHVSLLLI